MGEIHSFRDPIVDHGILKDAEEISEGGLVTPKQEEKINPGDPFTENEINFADDLLNLFGGEGRHLKYVEEPKQREKVRTLLKNYASLDNKSKSFFSERKETADGILEIIEAA